MKRTKIALLAFGLGMGLATVPVSVFAADSPAQESASSRSWASHWRGGMKDDCENESGMMGGRGYGMMGDHEGGMMGGMMDGHGMMESPRMGMLKSLDLSSDQRSGINKLSDELRHNNWPTRGLIMDESAKLRDLYAANKRDPVAIGKVYQKIFDLKRQMIEATIATQNRIEDLLTPEQRDQLNNTRKMAPKHQRPMR